MFKSINSQHSLVSVPTHWFEIFPQGFAWYFLIPKKTQSFHGRNERKIAKTERKWAVQNKTSIVTLTGLTDVDVGKKKKKNP